MRISGAPPIATTLGLLLVAVLVAALLVEPAAAQYGRPDATPAPRRFSLAATGDLLIHTPVRTRAALPDGGFDFTPQLAAASPDLAAADIGLCHLEVPLDPDGPYSSYPTFNAPVELADAIAAVGYDACSTASNHSADKGFAGLVRTIDGLDAAGILHEGMYRTEEEWLTPRLVEVAPPAGSDQAPITVGFISATYGLNGLPAPGGHEWSVLRIDPPFVVHRAALLRAAGAEVVIASLHFGNEYQHAPSTYQRQVATEIMTSGEVDAIIGHHAHVVQPVERIAGRPVVFGLGNFLSGQRQQLTRRDGAIVTLELVERTDPATGLASWSVEDVHAQPTFVDDAYRVQVAHPGDGGALGASAQRTLGHLGVPLSPDPGPSTVTPQRPAPPPPPPTHFGRG